MATHQGNMMGSSPLWALGKSRESIILVVMRFIKMRGAHTFSRDDIYHIEKRRYPPVAQSTYVILLVLGVLHLLVMWACFLVIVLPLKSQECKRRKYLWAFKRVYSGHISKSFIVPNSALAVGTTQFVSSTLCLISVALQYLSFASPQAASRVSLNAVVQIMWLFNFYGYWITGWAALCTVLCSAQSQIPNFIKPLSLMPKAVNTLCLTFPALVTIFSIGEAIIIFQGHIEESRAYNGTRDVMLQLVNAQENNQSLSLVLKSELVGNIADLINAVARLIYRTRFSSICWVIITLLTLVFLSVSGLSLVFLLRRTSSQISNIRVTDTQFREGGGLNSGAPIKVSSTNEMQCALKKGYTYLLCHNLVMILSILYTIAVCIVIALQSDYIITSSYWRALGSWLYLVSGLIVAVAMVLQSWRIFVDLDIFIPEKESRGARVSTPPGALRSGFSAFEETNFELETKIVNLCGTAEIHEARFGVRKQKAEVVVLRRAF